MVNGVDLGTVRAANCYFNYELLAAVRYFVCVAFRINLWLATYKIEM